MIVAIDTNAAEMRSRVRVEGKHGSLPDSASASPWHACTTSELVVYPGKKKSFVHIPSLFPRGGRTTKARGGDGRSPQQGLLACEAGWKRNGGGRRERGASRRASGSVSPRWRARLACHAAAE
ncbi:hypothetical protein MRX96_034736 [Rhipicephalus microplus]